MKKLILLLIAFVLCSCATQSNVPLKRAMTKKEVRDAQNGKSLYILKNGHAYKRHNYLFK